MGRGGKLRGGIGEFCAHRGLCSLPSGLGVGRVGQAVSVEGRLPHKERIGDVEHCFP